MIEGNYERKWQVVDDSNWRLVHKSRRRSSIHVSMDEMPLNATVEVVHKCSLPKDTKLGNADYSRCELTKFRQKQHGLVRPTYRFKLRHPNGYANGRHKALVRKTPVVNERTQVEPTFADPVPVRETPETPRRAKPKQWGNRSPWNYG